MPSPAHVLAGDMRGRRIGLDASILVRFMLHTYLLYLPPWLASSGLRKRRKVGFVRKSATHTQIHESAMDGVKSWMESNYRWMELYFHGIFVEARHISSCHIWPSLLAMTEPLWSSILTVIAAMFYVDGGGP